MADLQAEQLLADGLAVFRTKNNPKAIELFSLAKAKFQEAGNLVGAAEAANNLAYVCLKTGQLDAAWAQLAGTDTIFASAGDRQKQAMAVGNQAAVLEAQGKRKAALASYIQCNQILKEIGDHETRVPILNSISILQIRNADYFQALASRYTALDLKPRLSAKEKFLHLLLGILFKKLR